MQITWQAHHAVISERLRSRAEAALAKIERRIDRVVGATVRFEREDTRCRVEIVLSAPRHLSLVAEGNARYYGPALGQALTHLERQVADEHRGARGAIKRAVRRR